MIKYYSDMNSNERNERTYEVIIANQTVASFSGEWDSSAKAYDTLFLQAHESCLSNATPARCCDVALMIDGQRANAR